MWGNTVADASGRNTNVGLTADFPARFGRQRCQNKPVGFGHHIGNYAVGDVARHLYAYPMLLVHVIGRIGARVTFKQFGHLVGGAFKVAEIFLEIIQSKPFATHAIGDEVAVAGFCPRAVFGGPGVR